MIVIIVIIGRPRSCREGGCAASPPPARAPDSPCKPVQAGCDAGVYISWCFRFSVSMVMCMFLWFYVYAGVIVLFTLLMLVDEKPLISRRLSIVSYQHSSADVDKPYVKSVFPGRHTPLFIYIYIYVSMCVCMYIYIYKHTYIERDIIL